MTEEKIEPIAIELTALRKVKDLIKVLEKYQDLDLVWSSIVNGQAHVTKWDGDILYVGVQSFGLIYYCEQCKKAHFGISLNRVEKPRGTPRKRAGDYFS